MTVYHYLSYLLLCFILWFPLHGQVNPADSLAKEILELEKSPEKVDAFIRLAWELKEENAGLMFHYLNQAVELSEELEYISGKAKALYTTAKINFERQNYTNALNYFERALVYYRSTSDTLGLFQCFDGIGEIYKNEGNLEKALSYQLESLKFAEALADPTHFAKVYDELGEIYLQNSDPNKALFYYEKAFAFRQKVDDNPAGIIHTLSNLGNLYTRIGNYSEAERIHKKTISLAGLENHEQLLAQGKRNLAEVLHKQGKFDDAKRLVAESISSDKERKNWLPLAKDYILLAKIAFSQEDWSEAYRDAQLAFSFGKKVNALKELSESVELMTLSAASSGDYYAAYNAQNEWLALKDTLSSLQRNQVLEQLSFQNELDKRETENRLLKAENKANLETINQQRILSAAAILVLSILLIAALKFYQQKRKERKTNELLWARNNEIGRQNENLKKQNEEIIRQRNQLEQQKKEIEEINEKLGKQRNTLAIQNEQLEMATQNLTDSINYAQRMQSAMLPTIEEIKEKLPESFIFFQPRDVVSGDFYWFSTTAVQPIYEFNQDNPFHEATKVFKGFENEKIILVVADCTGHGVPGAFMSMKGDALLNQIINIRNIHRPDLVLEELHREVRNAFNQEETENVDGMDIAIVAFDPEEKRLEFAGAKAPLYMIKKGEQELQVIKGDLHPVGGEQFEEERKFKLHTFKISPEYAIFLSTDGYKDQFGGEKGKKFMSAPFRKLLAGISHLPAEKQEEEVKKAFFSWKGEEEQVDDVLVVGVRFS